jgi:hypothetical protein
MRIKTISYAMLRVTGQYENDRVEVTVELEDEFDNVGKAVKLARAACEKALVTTDYEGY